MKKIIIVLSFITAFNLFASSVAMSEIPKSAINFADAYFPDYYLYRAVENSGSFTLIFKGGLKIYINSKGEWTTVSGGGDEINIEYLEKEVINYIKKEFPNAQISISENTLQIIMSVRFDKDIEVFEKNSISLFVEKYENGLITIVLSPSGIPSSKLLEGAKTLRKTIE